MEPQIRTKEPSGRSLTSRFAGDMLNTFLATFLAIFIATAILTLASLPGWVRIPEKYRSRLFAALILQVVGSVVGFVSAGIQAGRASAGPSAAALTAEH